MSKVIEYKLEYNEEGAYGIVPISVGFISNAIIREYGEIEQIKNETIAKYSRIKQIENDIQKNGAEYTGEKLDELVKEVKTIVSELQSNKFQELPQRRFDLIVKILKRNGIIDGKLTSFEWWDECVEPSVELDFLETAVYKDLDSKKK